VAPGTEKYRHHAELPNSLGMKRGNALAERRLHQLEISERHALAGNPLGEL